MRYFLSLIILLCAGYSAGAQILNPVKWSYSAKKIGVGQYEVHLKAMIDPGWHVYAQEAGNGPIPTSFTFDTKASGVTLVGKTREAGKLKKAYDRNFNSILKYYENSVDFIQVVKASSAAKSVKGNLEYMVCNDRECLPPKDIDFDVKL